MIRDRSLELVRHYFGHPIPIFNRRIVDIGCGQGELLEGVKKENALSYLGVDSDEGLKTEWKKKQNDRYKFECKNLEKGLSFIEDSSADIVFCLLIFPYIKNKLQLFSEVARILAPGGCAYFANREHKSYTQIYRGWANAFLLARKDYTELIEKLQKACQERQLTYHGWEKEKDHFIREFGKKLDEGIEEDADTKEFEIECKDGGKTKKIQLSAVNFHHVFEKIAEGSNLKVEKSRVGAIMEKSYKFKKEDMHKFFENIGKAEGYVMLHINLEKQEDARPVGTTLTVLDSRILK